MYVHGLDFSVLEYPREPCAIIFLEGCKEQCSYCFNPELWEQNTEVNIDQVEDKLKTMLPFINAIVITGGEPLEQPEAVKELIALGKRYHLKIGLNTNGQHPNILKKLINNIDFVRFGLRATGEII